MQSARAKRDGTSFEALVIRMSNEVECHPSSRPRALGFTGESPTHHLHIAILYRYQLGDRESVVSCLAMELLMPLYTRN